MLCIPRKSLPISEKTQGPAVPTTSGPCVIPVGREDRRKCLAAGMDAYLPKPIDAAKLIKIVETARRRPADYRSSDTWEGPPVQNPSAASSPLINLKSARARMEDNEELVRDLANFFREDAPKLVGEIEQAIEQQQSEILQRAAHSLKGIAANFDAEALIILSMSLENSGRESDFDSARKELPELERLVWQVCKEFDEYLEQNH